MKSFFRFFYSAMAVVLFSACADSLSHDEVSAPTDGLVRMLFSATMGDVVESKTTYSNRNVYWEKTDVIAVISVGESVKTTPFEVDELLDNGSKARFEGLADASAETYYAVYPASSTGTYVDEKISVTFPPEQTAVANGFASGSNVSVAVSVKNAEVTEQSLLFKNAGALMAFKFDTAEDAANTKSVTFKARKSADDAETPVFWGLTGEVSVSIEDGIPHASEGNVDHVTVKAPVDGFKTGIVYYVPVSPVGDCTGMRVEFVDQNNIVYVKNNNVDFKLERSCLFNVGAIKRPYDDLPDEIRIDLIFKSTGVWPFNEKCVTAAVQETNSYAGDTYTYDYTYEANGVQKTKPLSFIIKGDTAAYTDGYYFTGPAGFKMLLPAISGRYIKAVRMVVKNTSVKTFKLVDFDDKDLAPSGSGTADTPAMISFPTVDNVVSKIGTAYYMCFPIASTQIFEISIIYSKTLPSSYDESDPFAQE